MCSAVPAFCCGHKSAYPGRNSELFSCSDFYLAMRTDRLWPSLPRNRPLNQLSPPGPSCVEQSTRWSACSRSCGAGVSTRVSNQNSACKLQMESRLCKVRPCNDMRSVPRKPLVSHNSTLLPQVLTSCAAWAHALPVCNTN